jgi:hypothetical protein
VRRLLQALIQKAFSYGRYTSSEPSTLIVLVRLLLRLLLLLLSLLMLLL